MISKVFTDTDQKNVFEKVCQQVLLTPKQNFPFMVSHVTQM